MMSKQIYGQTNIFQMLYPEFQITKKIRLIELFGGVGAQAKALERLGADFEHYRLSEWEVNACASYHKIHMREDRKDYSAPYTDKELVEILHDIGISTNGKTPMSKQKIKRKGEKWKRKVFNDFKATHNVGSVTNIHGPDLGIIDKDKYQYILCYSFPCQDLSVAGKRKGMSKGSNTRSGLLWEIERLLNECAELPDVLLMENVTQVHGQDNIDDFSNWIDYLRSKGYSNYYQDLNSKNYGVAQNRDRCFMVSILGDYHFNFPSEIKLTKCCEDYLEDQVDERYFLKSQKAMDLIQELIDKGELDNDNALDRQTDGWLTPQQTIQDQGQLQTALQQENQLESENTQQRAMPLSNSLGYIEKGTGKHQSNIVWNRKALAPTEDTKTSIWIVSDENEIRRTNFSGTDE